LLRRKQDCVSNTYKEGQVAKSQIVYKLTTQDNKTRKGYDNETVWGRNVTHGVTGWWRGMTPQLCSKAVIHCYEHPWIGIALNQARIKNPKIWVAKGVIVIRDDWQKAGCRRLTTLRLWRGKRPTKAQVRFIQEHSRRGETRWSADELIAEAKKARGR
jgi:hypothetical protein